MKSEYVRFRKTIGTVAFFEKSYKNTRTITDTVIDTIVSVTVSAFLCPFYQKWGVFLNFATHLWRLTPPCRGSAVCTEYLIPTYCAFHSLNDRYSLYY